MSTCSYTSLETASVAAWKNLVTGTLIMIKQTILLSYLCLWDSDNSLLPLNGFYQCTIWHIDQIGKVQIGYLIQIHLVIRAQWIGERLTIWDRNLAKGSSSCCWFSCFLALLNHSLMWWGTQCLQLLKHFNCWNMMLSWIGYYASGNVKLMLSNSKDAGHWWGWGCGGQSLALAVERSSSDCRHGWRCGRSLHTSLSFQTLKSLVSFGDWDAKVPVHLWDRQKRNTS